MSFLLLTSFENDDSDEEYDEEVSISSTILNADGKNELMLISSPNSSKDTSDDDHSTETNVNADECDEDEEKDSSQEWLSSKEKEWLVKNKISMA